MFSRFHGSLGKRVKIRVAYALKLNSIEVRGGKAKKNEHYRARFGVP